jgi:polysaccharide export outer membrane protein
VKYSKLICTFLGVMLTATAALSGQQLPATASAGILLRSGGDSPALRSTALAAVPEDFSTLHILPGFLLDMQVYDTPEYFLSLRVNDKGSVTIPLVGSIQVAGDTLPEAARKIEAALQEKQILTHPQVTLDVSQYAGTNVSVIGEVQNPGRIPLLAPHSLLDVIAMAGGETQIAGKEIEIKRADPAEHPAVITYVRGSNDDVLKNTTVNPGDTVVIPRTGIVYVLGAVNRPGGFIMQESGNLTVVQAVALAFGTTMQAATGAMRIVRCQPDGSILEIPVPYKDVNKGKAADVGLKPQDIVYVPVSKTKAILTGGTSVMSAATSAAIYSIR